MFVILWEYEVKPGNQVAFENAYMPDGGWVQLFKRDAHFRGTQLVQDCSRPFCYFTVDYWDSENSYKDFLSANRERYKELDDSLASLKERERHVLSFHIDSAILASR